ncbi:polysaccharide pyruvyl transferase family protein [Lactococcus lactis]
MFKKNIKLYYWKTPDGEPNFGDELGIEIINKLFPYLDIVYEPDIKKADLLSVGSLLHILLDLEFGAKHKKINVWGSGTIYPLQAEVGSIKTKFPIHSFSEMNISNIKFHAVRGQLTKNDLKLSKVHLGDPGLLANLVYEASKVKKYKLGVIPHFEDANNPLIKKFSKTNNVKIIDVLRAPQEVIADLTSCELIFSSSLHGLIVADSFGIPNIHMELSDKLVGGNFKFEDYYSSVDKEHKTAVLNTIMEERYWEKLITDYQPVKKLGEIQAGLLSSFPYKRQNFVRSFLNKK